MFILSKKFVFKTFLVLVFLFAQEFSGVSAANPEIKKETIKGVSILARSVIATGGPQQLLGLGDLSFSFEGQITNLTQYSSPLVTYPLAGEDFTIKIALDFTGNRFFNQLIQNVNGGLSVSRITRFDGDSFSIINPVQKTISTFPGTPEALIQFSATTLPPLLLRKALQNSSSVVWQGDSVIDGDTTDVISFSWDEKTRYFLHISKETGLVRALEFTLPDPYAGVDLIKFVFSGSKSVSGITFPEKVTQYRWDETNAEGRLTEIAVNSGLPDDLFETDPALTPNPPPVPRWEVVGDGIFEVRGLYFGYYRTTVIELEDSIVIFDAPINPLVAGQARKLIAEKIPGKPVSHVILSHHHIDHIGGLAAYAPENPKFVTVEENQDYLNKIFRAQYLTVNPFQPENTASLNFEFVSKESPLVIKVGNRTIEINNIGPISHVDNMLIAHVKDAKVIIQGDLYSPNSSSNPTYEAFANLLKDKAGSVELVLGIHHDPITPEAIIKEFGK